MSSARNIRRGGRAGDRYNNNNNNTLLPHYIVIYIIIIRLRHPRGPSKRKKTLSRESSVSVLNGVLTYNKLHSTTRRQHNRICGPFELDTLRCFFLSASGIMCALSISVPLARERYYIYYFRNVFSPLARSHTPIGTYTHIHRYYIICIVFFM